MLLTWMIKNIFVVALKTIVCFIDFDTEKWCEIVQISIIPCIAKEEKKFSELLLYKADLFIVILMPISIQCLV
jgi:hypothetical protein